jgi:hypothetical protein
MDKWLRLIRWLENAIGRAENILKIQGIKENKLEIK